MKHGCVACTGRCFFDVAGFNEYELVACRFERRRGGASLFESLKRYKVYFPALGKSLKQLAETEQARALRDF